MSLVMPDTDPKQNDAYSESETAARREAALKRMLATPPENHKPLGAKERLPRQKSSTIKDAQ